MDSRTVFVASVAAAVVQPGCLCLQLFVEMHVWNPREGTLRPGPLAGPSLSAQHNSWAAALTTFPCLSPAL